MKFIDEHGLEDEYFNDEQLNSSKKQVIKKKFLSTEIDSKVYRESIDFLIDLYINSNKKNMIVVNIGTPKVRYDSLAPIVGTLIEDELLYIDVYGSLQNPIHALNLEKKYSEIKQNNSESFIIGIDAALSPNNESIGSIIVKNGPIRPGSGVGKKLTPVGNAAIMGIVSHTDKVNNDTIGNNISEDEILDIAKIIVMMLKDIDNAIIKIKNKKIS